MVAFEVSINGEVACVAGVADLGVLTAILTRVRRRDSSTEELTLDAGGLDTSESAGGEHLKWVVGRTLAVGDSDSVRVVEADTRSAPAQRYHEDPAQADLAKRAYYERLKREYGD